MVLDKIENSHLYTSLSERIAKAFDYIKSTDLANTENGTYEIDGMDVFAMVQDYDTKPWEEGKVEAHHKHIDVQYIVSGEELMGVASKTNQAPYLENKEDDYDFYECETRPVLVKEGMFTIFFPEDLHKPCIQVSTPTYVKKVVVKVKI
jgi:YhcH/YjgK/YiaL family protein